MNRFQAKYKIQSAWWRLGLLAVVLAAVFWSSAGVATAAKPVPPASCQLAFYDYNVIPPGQVRTSFSASLDNVAYLRSTWSHAAGSHTAHYRVYSPDGALYQDLAVAFNGAPSGSTVVWGALPIAGSWMGRLPGVWTVRMTLDSNPTVLTTNQFTLTY